MCQPCRWTSCAKQNVAADNLVVSHWRTQDRRCLQTPRVPDLERCAAADIFARDGEGRTDCDRRHRYPGVARHNVSC